MATKAIERRAPQYTANVPHVGGVYRDGSPIAFARGDNVDAKTEAVRIANALSTASGDHSLTELMEAAACLWEGALNNRDLPEIDACFEAQGASAVRMAVIELAGPVLDAWEALSGDRQDAEGPFDWEFVPAFLAQRVDWYHLPTLSAAQ